MDHSANNPSNCATSYRVKSRDAAQKQVSVEHFCEKLRSLLQKLDSESRQHVIQGQLTELQRRRLEMWMRKRKDVNDKSFQLCPLPDDQTSSLSESESESAPESVPDAVEELPAIADVPKHEGDGEGNMHHFDNIHARDQPNWKQRGVIVSRKMNMSYYFGMTCIASCVVRGRYHRQLQDAVQDHMCLVAIKQRFAGALGAPLGEKNRLKDAIRSVSVEHGIEAKYWRVRFSIPAGYWVGTSLKTIEQDWEDAIENGFSCLDLLPWRDDPRGRGGPLLFKFGLTPQAAQDIWTRLRNQYIRVSEATGANGGAIRLRLDELEARHKARQDDNIRRWHRHQELVKALGKQKLCRQITRVLLAWERHEARVKRARVAAERAAMYARQRQRLCSSRQLRSEKDMTMEQILGRRSRQSTPPCATGTA
eukprot:TRINITY_DN4221_c0_g1_i3.p1 TRINITY_DN4221_c0_g1~~TRINITY_DN4221_c0_g1_i3.p1  ORF type:complete len:422 (-),score=28.93 TRINITY_DN4221_c0_g1_i3:332-1597(-)